jgi:hypothetical protein
MMMPRLLNPSNTGQWIMTMKGEQASAEVVLFSPRPAVGGVNREAAVERRGRGT